MQNLNPVPADRWRQPDRASRGARGSTPRVLVVDDNAINRRVAACVCELLGYVYAEAEDGEDAVVALQHGDFDVILMDIRMPRMDGVQAAGAIRRLGSNVPIIAVTADFDTSDVARYTAVGMSAVVPKPVSVDRLIAAIKDALSPASAPALAAPEKRSFVDQPSPTAIGRRVSG